jgi:hypothetical protein
LKSAGNTVLVPFAECAAAGPAVINLVRAGVEKNNSKRRKNMSRTMFLITTHLLKAHATDNSEVRDGFKPRRRNSLRARA